MIVVPEPSRGEVLHLVDIIEQVLRQPFIADRSIEALDISVLLRLPRLDVFDPDALALSPGLERGTNVFRAVVNAEWLSAIRGDEHP